MLKRFAAAAEYASKNAPSKPSASSTCPTSWRRIAATVSAKTASNFSVYPCLRREQCLGLLGQNGIGKTTTLKVFSGEIKPNLGRYDDPPDWPEIIQYYRGSSLQDYFQKMSEKKLKVSSKPQYVDKIPKAVIGQSWRFAGKS